MEEAARVRATTPPSPGWAGPQVPRPPEPTTERVDQATPRTRPRRNRACALAADRGGRPCVRRRYPPLAGQWRVRVAGAVLVAATAFYLPWMLESLEHRRRRGSSYPFLARICSRSPPASLAVFNGWSAPRSRAPSAAAGEGADRGVIVPTCSEPVPLVLRTIESVYEQDWPARPPRRRRQRRRTRPRARGGARSGYPVLYHSPPPRFARAATARRRPETSTPPSRSSIASYPGIRYVETRDADDELGSTGFLRQVIGQLEADPEARLRADDQGGAGLVRRSVQQP